jgi:hypothetical protein
MDDLADVTGSRGTGAAVWSMSIVLMIWTVRLRLPITTRS